MIGGVSFIFDRAARVGDMMNGGTALGVGEDIGLRSTRIRTLDRTLVSVPNGQLATANLENISARDKFWFHHNPGLRYETPASIVRSILEGVTKLLRQHALIESSSVRVFFLRFGASSLDLEIFAYVLARDWVHFLEVQQELLLRIMEIVEASGGRMAIPSHITYLAGDSSTDSAQLQTLLQRHPNNNGEVPAAAESLQSTT